MKKQESDFVWDPDKERLNLFKHGVDFRTAAQVFRDPGRRIMIDEKHSQQEPRLFCLGKVDNRVLTVRYTNDGHKIRIIGAGYWRKGKRLYDQEEEN